MKACIVVGVVVVTLVTGTSWAAHAGAKGDRAAAALAAAKGGAQTRREAVPERHEVAKQKGEVAKERREAAREKAEAANARREAAREKAEAAKAAREAARAEAKDKRSEAGSARVDQRQSNQAKRIQHGVTKGYLASDEMAKLTAQQSRIAELESALKSDGKLSRDEFKQVRTELNEASRCIWAEKHDTGGNQMATCRLGKDVFAKDDLTAKLADENLSTSDAKVLLKDFRRTVDLKHKLSADDLSDTERAERQAEYDTLLNTYFELR